jgi:hypothetical protein
MDLNSILQGGFVLTLTFGAVSAVNIFYKQLDSKWNLGLSFVFALIFAFIPANLGNIILNQIKNAVAVAVSLNGAYQFLSGIAKKVSNN